MPERSRKRRPADLNALAVSLAGDSVDGSKDERDEQQGP